MATRTKSLRNRLAANRNSCFYCGLPFNINPIPESEAFYKKFARYSRSTLEHLEAIVRGGKTTEENCVLAHAWCNTLAEALPIAQKFELKARLTNYAQLTNQVPWLDKKAFAKPKSPKISKRINIKKSELKDKLLAINDRCFYCNMPFNVVPIEPGGPFFRKFKSYARALVEVTSKFNIGDPLDGTNCILTHHWCRNKTRHLSDIEKLEYKRFMSESCLANDTLPWLGFHRTNS
jgi:hypothetical protein